MSFFEPPPPAPEPEREHPQPEWLGPAENVLPAPFELALTLVRTDGLGVTAHAGLAYPNGFTFRLQLLLRTVREAPHGNPFHHWHTAARTGKIPLEAFRFGLRFADGSKATVFGGQRFFARAERPDGPVLIQRGGGGGMHSWDFAFWVWPLPPEGPLAFVCEWPSEGVELTQHEIDTAPIRDAAARAETLWPNGGDGHTGSGGAFIREIR